MNAALEECLEDLELRLDDAVEAQLLDQWRSFAALRCDTPIFAPERPTKSPPRVQWPAVRVNQALDDFAAMALQQCGACSEELDRGSGNLLMVRSNYGTPILPTLFGCALFVMPDETNTLPACQPIPGGSAAMQALVERGVPALEHPYLQKVFEMGRRLMAIREAYPKIGRWVHVYHPDLQGPMDVLEMVWGSGIFVALYDEPQLVHALLDIITQTYTRVLQAWEQIVPPMAGGVAPHWGLLHRGRIMLRDDSAMNLAPEQFAEFIAPYDQRLLTTFGGGAMHACGRVEHFIGHAAHLRGLHAFHMSQPQLNDLAKIWPATIERGIVLLALERKAAAAAQAAGLTPRGRVHCA